MQLTSQTKIDAAMNNHGKVPQARRDAIVASVRATRPERMDELDAIFSESLPAEEKAFYHDIVEGRTETAAAPTGAVSGEAPVPTSHESES